MLKKKKKKKNEKKNCLKTWVGMFRVGIFWVGVFPDADIFATAKSFSVKILLPSIFNDYM